MKSRADMLSITGKGAFNPPKAFLPLLTTPVEAGFPSPAEDYVEKSIDLNQELVSNPLATYFVRVQGESMVDAGIHNGDVLVVDRSVEPKNGSVVVAILDGEFTVKRLCLGSKGPYLQACNPSFSSPCMDSYADFQIWGVVCYVIHKL